MRNLDLVQADNNIYSCTSLSHLVENYREATRPTEAQYRSIEKRFSQCLKKGDCQGSVNILRFWAVNDTDFISKIRKKGILRSSQYDYNSVAVSCAVRSLLSISVFPPGNESRYLESRNLISSIIPEAKKTLDKIDAFIAENLERFLKSCVVFSDWLFKQNSVVNYLSEKQIERSTKEDIADAVSFLIFRFSEKYPVSSKYFNSLDESGLQTEIYDNLIAMALSLRKLDEVEMLIDCFDYSVNLDSREVSIVAPTETFHKSIHLGYIFSVLQKTNRLLLVFESEPPAASLRDLESRLYEEFSSKFFGVKNEPIERFVFMIPDAPQIWDLFRTDEIYVEDILLIEELNIELHATTRELMEFYFGRHLRVFDVVKVMRLFSFIRNLFNRFLSDQGIDKTSMVIRSLLPVFRRDVFHSLLANVISGPSAEEFISFCTWKKEGFLDLQYQPLIESQGFLLVPMNILGTANLVRNIMMSTRTRIFSDDSVDPITRRLKSALESNGFRSHQIKYSFKGVEGDIDLICKIGQFVFVFEAKNSILPAATSELRTSFDYIRTGAKQLKKIEALWSDESFLLYLGSLIGEDLTGTRFLGSIVTGNRLFYGYHEMGYPVIFTRELANFMETNTVTLVNDRYHIYDPSLAFEIRLERFIFENLFHLQAHSDLEFTKCAYKLGDFSIIDNVGSIDLVSHSSRLIGLVYSKHSGLDAG